jgi:hypothetical protein
MAATDESDQPFDAAFEPYDRQIGLLLRSWNDLQEKLADLFSTLTSPHDGGLARAIWYAIPNDRLQRAALRAAAEYLFHSDSTDDVTIKAEIKWIVDRANSLGQQRDTAAHAPVSFLIDEPYELISRQLQGNPLAKQLEGKKLLEEFRLYRQRAIMLHEHADVIEQYLRLGRGSWTWPKRPIWP